MLFRRTSYSSTFCMANLRTSKFPAAFCVMMRTCQQSPTCVGGPLLHPLPWRHIVMQSVELLCTLTMQVHPRFSVGNTWRMAWLGDLGPLVSPWALLPFECFVADAKSQWPRQAGESALGYPTSESRRGWHIWVLFCRLTNLSIEAWLSRVEVQAQRCSFWG